MKQGPDLDDQVSQYSNSRQ